MQAADLIRSHLRDFELIIVGDGPERPHIVNAMSTRPWIHYVGPVTGAERARYFRASRALLMPGPIGLIAADSFVTTCPIVTTHQPFHGPEFGYLEDGVNSIVTRFDASEYARRVVACFQDPVLHGRLRQGCEASASRYSLASMVERFSAGIEHCLQSRMGQ